MSPFICWIPYVRRAMWLTNPMLLAAAACCLLACLLACCCLLACLLLSRVHAANVACACTMPRACMLCPSSPPPRKCCWPAYISFVYLPPCCARKWGRKGGHESFMGKRNFPRETNLSQGSFPGPHNFPGQ